MKTGLLISHAFEGVHLLPGEEKQLAFILAPQALGWWNKDNHLVVEPRCFTVMVGASSEDIRLKGKIEVKD